MNESVCVCVWIESKPMNLANGLRSHKIRIFAKVKVTHIGRFYDSWSIVWISSLSKRSFFFFVSARNSSDWWLFISGRVNKYKKKNEKQKTEKSEILLRTPRHRILFTTSGARARVSFLPYSLFSIHLIHDHDATQFVCGQANGVESDKSQIKMRNNYYYYRRDWLHSISESICLIRCPLAHIRFENASFTSIRAIVPEWCFFFLLPFRFKRGFEWHPNNPIKNVILF